MNDKSELEAYLRLSGAVERLLVRTVCVLAIMVLLAQALLGNAEFRRFVTKVDKLEGRPYMYRANNAVSQQ